VDRIHVHFAGEAAELAHALWLDLGVPYTVMVHAVDLFKPRPSLESVLGAAETVLTVCDHHRAVLDTRGIRARVLRCGPRLTDWAGLPPPPGGPLRALFVGRNVPKKGLDTLLSAWPPGDPGARLLVVSGDVSSVPPGVRVQSPGPPAAVRAAMAWANLVVLPCRVAPDGDRDGVPLVLMEAIAAGRPVLSTPVAGIPELVEPPVGWLCAPDRPRALRDLLDGAVQSARETRSPGPAWLQARGFTLAAQVDGLCRTWSR
jgi:glycosyltransferase involved in cell wall biosynthesis